jgi:hypothetical protein
MPMRQSVPLVPLTCTLRGKCSRASILDVREAEASTANLRGKLRAMSGSSAPRPGGDNHEILAARPRCGPAKGELYPPLHHPLRLARPHADLDRNRGAA